MGMLFQPVRLAKPQDEVSQLLARAEPTGCNVTVSMGPKGLTRAALTLCRPQTPIAEDLARVVEIPYKQNELDQVRQRLGGEQPSFIEYVADAKGYTVVISFAGLDRDPSSHPLADPPAPSYKTLEPETPKAQPQ